MLNTFRFMFAVINRIYPKNQQYQPIFYTWPSYFYILEDLFRSKSVSFTKRINSKLLIWSVGVAMWPKILDSDWVRGLKWGHTVRRVSDELNCSQLIRHGIRRLPTLPRRMSDSCRGAKFGSYELPFKKLFKHLYKICNIIAKLNREVF